jgi:hypothetical protein
MIAIPLESERRAALLLSALRRLEAEYREDRPALPAPAPAPRAPAGVRGGVEDSLIGGLLGALLAAVCASAVHGAPVTGSVVGLIESAPLVLAGGFTLGALAGLTLSRLRRAPWRRPLGAAAGTSAPSAVAPMDDGAAAGASDAVTWLVAYVRVDRDEAEAAGAGRVRTTVVRLDLPRSAEWRLKATLARAADVSPSTRDRMPSEGS